MKTTAADLFRSAVEAVIGPRVDYCAIYKGTVALQHDDGTVDVIPDDEKIKALGLSNLPIRHGLPGFTVKVPKGTRILVGFTAADPKQPYAALWEAGDAISVEYKPGGISGPVSRAGDTVYIVLPYTPLPTPGPPVPFVVTGVIQTGNSKLLA